MYRALGTLVVSNCCAPVCHSQSLTTSNCAIGRSNAGRPGVGLRISQENESRAGETCAGASRTDLHGQRLYGSTGSRWTCLPAILSHATTSARPRTSDARFEGEVQESFVQSLRQAFLKSQEELWAFFRQVGIDPRLLAASVIEESLASNMLFYGAETRVANVNDMVWCCFPFCFRRPT